MTALAKVTNGSLPTLSNWIEDWFGRDFTSMSNGFNTGINIPAVNIQETADSFLVEMAAPGMKKSDFKINLDNNLLTISRESRHEEKHGENHFTRREFGYSSFKRTFTLPESVDNDRISAQYKDGILLLTLPKKEEARLKPARTINIK